MLVSWIFVQSCATEDAVQSSRLAVPKASHADAAPQERIMTESVLKAAGRQARSGTETSVHDGEAIFGARTLCQPRRHLRGVPLSSLAQADVHRFPGVGHGVWCGCCYHRSRLSPVHAHSRPAWVVPIRFANRCHRGNQDRREGLQVWVVGRPNGRVRAEVRVSTLPQRQWLSLARWATR